MDLLALERQHTYRSAPAADEEEVDPMSRQVTHAAESAVQRIADALIWLLFRLNGVRS